MPRPCFYAIHHATGYLTDPAGNPTAFRSRRAAEIAARALGDGWTVVPLPITQPPPPTDEQLEQSLRRHLRG